MSYAAAISASWALAPTENSSPTYALYSTTGMISSSASANSVVEAPRGRLLIERARRQCAEHGAGRRMPRIQHLVALERVQLGAPERVPQIRRLLPPRGLVVVDEAGGHRGHLAGRLLIALRAQRGEVQVAEQLGAELKIPRAPAGLPAGRHARV